MVAVVGVDAKQLVGKGGLEGEVEGVVVAFYKLSLKVRGTGLPAS